MDGSPGGGVSVGECVGGATRDQDVASLYAPTSSAPSHSAPATQPQTQSGVMPPATVSSSLSDSSAEGSTGSGRTIVASALFSMNTTFTPAGISWPLNSASASRGFVSSLRSEEHTS